MKKTNKVKSNVIHSITVYIAAMVLALLVISCEAKAEESSYEDLYNIKTLMKCYTFSGRAGIFDRTFLYEEVLWSYDSRYHAALVVQKGIAVGFLAGYSIAGGGNPKGIDAMKATIKATAIKLYESYRESCSEILEAYYESELERENSIPDEEKGRLYI